MDIHVIVNNKNTALPEGTLLSDLLKKNSYEGRVSVWIDDVQLLAADYPNRLLFDGEKIRIIRLVGGG